MCQTECSDIMGVLSGDVSQFNSKQKNLKLFFTVTEFMKMASLGEYLKTCVHI